MIARSIEEFEIFQVHGYFVLKRFATVFRRYHWQYIYFWLIDEVKKFWSNFEAVLIVLVTCFVSEILKDK